MDNNNPKFGFEMVDDNNPFGEGGFAVELPEDMDITPPADDSQDPPQTEPIDEPQDPQNVADPAQDTPPVDDNDPTPPNDDTPDDAGDYSDLFKNHFQLLQKAGLVYDDSLQLDETASNFEEVLLKNEMARNNMVAAQLLESLPEKLRAIVDYGLDGGKDLDQFFQAEKRIEEFNYDVSKPEEQEILVREYLKSKGNNDFAVNAIVDRLKDDDKLADEANTAFQTMKQAFEQERQTLLENQKTAKQQQEQRNREKHEGVVTYLKAQDKWTSKAQEEVYSKIYKPDEQYSGNSYVGAVMSKIYDTPEFLVQFTKLITDQFDFEKGFNLESTQETQNNIKTGIRNQLGALLQQSSTPTNYSNKQKTQIDWSNTEAALPGLDKWY